MGPMAGGISLAVRAPMNFRVSLAPIFLAAVCRAAVGCLVLLAVLTHAPPVSAEPLMLTWDHSVDRDVDGYLVSYGTQSGKYTTSIDVGYVTSIRLNDLNDTATYYFVVQSYNGAGPGPPSEEVTSAVVVLSPDSDNGAGPGLPSEEVTSAVVVRCHGRGRRCNPRFQMLRVLWRMQGPDSVMATALYKHPAGRELRVYFEPIEHGDVLQTEVAEHDFSVLERQAEVLRAILSEQGWWPVLLTD